MPLKPALFLPPLLALAACAAEAPRQAAEPPPVSVAPAAPEVFAPGSLSTAGSEAYATFTPDGRTAVLSRYSAFGADDNLNTLYVSHREGDTWSEPVVAPFSGEHFDHMPFFSPDGSRLFFVSRRPVGGAARDDLEIWAVEHRDGSWGEPRHLGEIGSPADEYAPAVTEDGSLLFSSTRPDGRGSGDLYVARVSDQGYGKPENLGAPINGPSGEWGSCLSPDGSALVFESSGREGNLSYSGDLYVSFRRGEGWSEPVHLCAQVNSTASDLGPRFSADGRTLFFASSRRGGQVDLFAVDWRALEARLRPPF